jgi:hypothetical protein
MPASLFRKIVSLAMHRVAYYRHLAKPAGSPDSALLPTIAFTSKARFTSIAAASLMAELMESLFEGHRLVRSADDTDSAPRRIPLAML